MTAFSEAARRTTAASCSIRKIRYLGSFLRRANLMASNKEHDSYAIDKVTLLQFTGLKDKDGVEIYEGDIIKNGRGPRTAIVQWDGGSAGWFMKYLPNPGTNYTRGWSVAAEWARYEVIGNIYENSELVGAQS